MHNDYTAGGYGYGHAKQALYEALLHKFDTARQLFNEYMKHPDRMEQILKRGADRAKSTADPVLQRVRTQLGF
jgi:tryptophanyl-tRNA synthetase